MTTAKKKRTTPSPEVLEDLASMAGDLRRHNFFRVADCLERYLQGKARSLDEAFGVTDPAKRGRPKVREERHLRLARELLAFRLDREAGRRSETIGQFEIELAQEYNLSDARKVREIYAKYENAVMVEEICRRLRKG